MATLPPMTVAEALHKVQHQEFVLPAIQREFVWNPGQITTLFDSLMRGYPMGSFLSWKLEAGTVNDFKFYGFMKDFNEFNCRHNPELEPLGHVQQAAILDGQQRLTALNIGLRGSYAWRNKNSWARFAENYPRRVLHLNLAGLAEENAAGLKYDLRFLQEDQLRAMHDETRAFWLPVPEVLASADPFQLTGELGNRGLGNSTIARDLASRLWKAVHSTQSLTFFEETDQSIERVLDIFIRVNSGGTQLSYSDLLLSIATAQWSVGTRGARSMGWLMTSTTQEPVSASPRI